MNTSALPHSLAGGFPLQRFERQGAKTAKKNFSAIYPV
jgi:hypothetical protein